MSRMVSRFGVLGIVITVAGILFASYCIATTPDDLLGADIVPSYTPASEHEQVGYTLPEGRSAEDIGEDLEALGVVRSGAQFEFLVSLMGMQSQLGSGDYLLRTNSSVVTVISELTVREAVPVLKVTFPEGIRIEEMAIIAEEAGFGTRDQYMAATLTAELPQGFAETRPAGASLEGYLFPDTYIMPVGSTMEELIAYQLRVLVQRFTPELRSAAAEQGLNPHEALTLASIVEREAVLAEERPRIAGVFYNRLEEEALLQADPTVQYAVSLVPGSVEQFGYWKEELTQADLQIDSPYNTYKYPLLPPGPIANAGLASIEAVAEPEDTDYYYFYANAKADDGSHVFAVTLAEHEQNIAEYGAP